MPGEERIITIHFEGNALRNMETLHLDLMVQGIIRDIS